MTASLIAMNLKLARSTKLLDSNTVTVYTAQMAQRLLDDRPRGPGVSVITTTRLLFRV